MRDLSRYHWKMTSRNSRERNGGSRNDAALRGMTSALEGVSVTSFFVQTCGHRNTHYSHGSGELLVGACPHGHPDCYGVSAVFVSGSGDVPRDDANVMARVARKLHVPGFLVMHVEGDEMLSEPVRIARVLPGGVSWSDGTWDDVTGILREAQHRHEVKSQHPECRSTGIEWLKDGTGIGAGVDLSLSNAIRAVPGVRHTDIDAVLACLDCGEPVVLIEASSDGITPRESAFKSATVARVIGRRTRTTTLLIQHQVGDAEHSEPVSLTWWMVTGNVSDTYDHATTDWATAERVTQNIIDDHGEMFC